MQEKLSGFENLMLIATLLKKHQFLPVFEYKSRLQRIVYYSSCHLAKLANAKVSGRLQAHGEGETVKYTDVTYVQTLQSVATESQNGTLQGKSGPRKSLTGHMNSLYMH